MKATCTFLHWAVVVAPLVMIGAGCARERPGDTGRVRVGFVNGPLAATLYVAEAQATADGRASAFTGIPLSSSGDIGYALMAGDIDAGFIETPKAAALFRAVNGLRAVGAVTFPYGATLVLRKDLDLRLDGVAGRTVAVAGRRCRLLHQFTADAARFGVDTETIRFVPMPFDQMIPSLEAGRVDAILTRGGHALLAVAHDHKVLYQNWVVTGTDECCPQTLAHVELVLVTRAKDVCPHSIPSLVSALETASSVPSHATRSAVAARTRIPLAALEPFPVVIFETLTPEQQAELGGSPVDEEEAHDHDCDQDGCTH